MNDVFYMSSDMKNKTFYCHKCGEQLGIRERTRIVRRGDPDYKKYRKVGYNTRLIGDINLTEYDFQCPGCANLLVYDEQYVIAKIQVKLRKRTLTEEEIASKRGEIEKEMARSARNWKIFFSVLTWILLALYIYHGIKTGEFPFFIHF